MSQRFITVQSATQILVIDVKRVVSCRFDLEKNNAFFKFNNCHYELIKNVVDFYDLVNEIQQLAKGETAEIG